MRSRSNETSNSNTASSFPRRATSRGFLTSSRAVAPTAAITPVERQPIVPPLVTKFRKSRTSDRQTSNRVHKSRQDEGHGDPRAALVGKLTDSIDTYRESLHNETINGLSETENELLSKLEDLTTDVDAEVQKLSEAEEPLRKPFNEEALTKLHAAPNSEEVAAVGVLLSDSISEFRKLHDDKVDALEGLWKEWENTQFEIMTLAVEVFGRESLGILQLQTDAVKPGQRDRLDTVLNSHDNASKNKLRRDTTLHQDLKSFENDVGLISSGALEAVNDIMASYAKKKEEYVEHCMKIIVNFPQSM